MHVAYGLFFVVLLVPPLTASAAAFGQTKQQKQYNKEAGPRPDLEDVSYGSHERLKLDLWKAKADQPSPVLVFFHGGGGDKLMYRGNRILAFCLAHGISAAAVNYRLNNQAPFPVRLTSSNLRDKCGAGNDWLFRRW